MRASLGAYSKLTLEEIEYAPTGSALCHPLWWHLKACILEIGNLTNCGGLHSINSLRSTINPVARDAITQSLSAATAKPKFADKPCFKLSCHCLLEHVIDKHAR